MVLTSTKAPEVSHTSHRAAGVARYPSWEEMRSAASELYRPRPRSPQIGPYLVTADDVPDPQNLSMWLDVNGERVQDGSTNTMIYGVAHIISHLSEFMTLRPGDVISTGTPPGVGMGMTPPRYLKAGDEVRLGIEGLGEQHQICEADTA